MTTLPRHDPPRDLDMAEPFWAAVERGAIALPRCSVCGEWQWYPEVDGTDCAGGSLVWEDVPTTGTVHTFTRVHRWFLPGDRGPVPFVTGTVDLDTVDGVHLVVNFDDDAGLAVGRRVRMRVERVGDRAHPVFALSSEEAP